MATTLLSYHINIKILKTNQCIDFDKIKNYDKNIF